MASVVREIDEGECILCLNPFDSAYHIPLELPTCYDTLCLTCIANFSNISMLSKLEFKFDIKCPQCKVINELPFVVPPEVDDAKSYGLTLFNRLKCKQNS